MLLMFGGGACSVTEGGGPRAVRSLRLDRPRPSGRAPPARAGQPVPPARHAECAITVATDLQAKTVPPAAARRAVDELGHVGDPVLQGGSPPRSARPLAEAARGRRGARRLLREHHEPVNPAGRRGRRSPRGGTPVGLRRWQPPHVEDRGVGVRVPGARRGEPRAIVTTAMRDHSNHVAIQQLGQAGPGRAWSLGE